jgi:hypothetical protein
MHTIRNYSHKQKMTKIINYSNYRKTNVTIVTLKTVKKLFLFLCCAFTEEGNATEFSKSE